MTSQVSLSVSSELVESALVIRFDDGKANTLSKLSLDQLNAALDNANEAKSICILGRQGFFCAGYDLDELASGPDQAHELGRAGRKFLRRLIATDLPVVAGVSGHALAAGAALMLACDFRVGSRGPFRIGFNEISNGLPLSELTLELAARRLAPAALEKAILGSELADPERAVHLGFLDSVVEPSELEAVAIGQAKRLARPDTNSMKTTKARLRKVRARNETHNSGQKTT